MILAAFEFLFFDSAKEASINVTTFLKLRFITEQKPALFLEKYYMLTSSKSRRFHLVLSTT